MSENGHQDWVVETTDQTFEKDVMERSRDTVVVVDFWASWCAPCRMLGPILEDLAKQYDGRFTLVKADTEKTPQAATEFRVEGIPAVFGVAGGEVVDFFQGALPESQIRQWLDGLLVRGELADAKKLEATEPAAAEAIFRRVAEQRPNDPDASIGLARVLAVQGNVDEATAIIERLEQRGFLEPEAEQVKASLELRGGAQLDIEQCRRDVEEHPGELEYKFELARALAASEEFAEALALCLELVEKDKQGIGESARQTMVDIFHSLPNDSGLVSEFRRKLSMALY